ncbi:hypothetical protein FI667_g10817, partial [Globisporangium splendens]
MLLVFALYSVSLLFTEAVTPAPTPTPQATPTDGCCAKCIGKTTDLPYTYDPLVYTQCSAAKGVCCFNCGQDSSAITAPINFVNAEYGDDGVTPQVPAGTWIQLTWGSTIKRVTYETYQPTQLKTTTVRNGSAEARVVPGSNAFYICAKAPGFIYVRGWGADPCLRATPEEHIKIVEGKTVASCGKLPNESDDDDDDEDAGATASAAASTKSPSTSTTPTMTLNDGEETCNTQRASMELQPDGTKLCVCAAEWSGPPSCSGYPWWKIAITIGGAVAACLSIVVSIKAYTKSKNKPTKQRSTGDTAMLDEDPITIAGRESMAPRRPSHDGYEGHRDPKPVTKDGVAF